MPSIADIVREELAAAVALAETRIASRIADLLAGGGGAAPSASPSRALRAVRPSGSPAPKGPPKVGQRFGGRVRARLTPEAVEAARKIVLGAFKPAEELAAGEVMRRTGLDRHRAQERLAELVEGKRLRRKGEGRNVRYSLPAR